MPSHQMQHNGLIQMVTATVTTVTETMAIGSQPMPHSGLIPTPMAMVIIKQVTTPMHSPQMEHNGKMLMATDLVITREVQMLTGSRTTTRNGAMLMVMDMATMPMETILTCVQIHHSERLLIQQDVPTVNSMMMVTESQTISTYVQRHPLEKP